MYPRGWGGGGGTEPAGEHRPFWTLLRVEFTHDLTHDSVPQTWQTWVSFLGQGEWKQHLVRPHCWLSLLRLHNPNTRCHRAVLRCLLSALPSRGPSGETPSLHPWNQDPQQDEHRGYPAGRASEQRSRDGEIMHVDSPNPFYS